MGLDQLIKVIVKKDKPNKDYTTSGRYKEFYFRKNYYLQSKYKEFCYTKGITEDNCINFEVDIEKFFEFHEEVLKNLQRWKDGTLNTTEFPSIDYEEDLKELNYMFKQVSKMYKEGKTQIFYWQWY